MAPPGRVDVTKADVGAAAPITTIELADDGGKPLAVDWRNVAAMALKNDDDVRNNPAYGLNNKVNRDGDTMTGTLLIAPASGPGLVAGAALASNQPAAQFVGDGTGAGLTTQGGATGPGLQMISGAGAAGEAGRSIGYMHYTGTQPAKGADPGDNNVQHGTNITKAWGTVSLTGGAPYTTIDDYNVTNVTEPVANIYRINFVRPFANATYAITFTPHSPGTGVSISSKNAAYCEFNVWETDAPGTPFPGRIVDFVAVGRQ